ncbi:MAG: hypothetical protein AABY89_13075 [Acidobacteriota bacterium]
MVLAVALGCLVGAEQAAPVAREGSPDISRLTISSPATVRELKSSDLRGVPTRLAWSPDGTRVYLRLSTFDRWANETARHVVLDLAGQGFATEAYQPAWAARYWEWKSGPTSPALQTWRITFESREELVRTTNVPREGNIGQHGADPNAGLDETVRNAANASQKTRFETLTLQGELIDRAINRSVTPGARFSWAPAPRPLIVYVTQKGRLVIRDNHGKTRQIGGVKDVLLPAWSDDGRRIAFLQKFRNDTWSVRTVDIQ